MITAKEARERSDKVRGSNMLEEMHDITALIEEATRKGEYQCYYTGSVSLGIRKYFEELGYKLTSYNQYNEITYTISW